MSLTIMSRSKIENRTNKRLTKKRDLLEGFRQTWVCCKNSSGPFENL